MLLFLQVLAKQSEPLCWACFDEDLLRLVRKAVRLKGLIRPGDRVLAALSGGEPAWLAQDALHACVAAQRCSHGDAHAGAASLALVRLLHECCNTNPSRGERGQVCALVPSALHIAD